MSKNAPEWGGGGKVYMGKWTAEEEEYAMNLIEHFKEGNLDNVATGTSLRKHMAEMLKCSPKRVSKKLEDSRYNGRHKFLRNHTMFSPEEALQRRNRLEHLRSAFLQSRDHLVQGIIPVRKSNPAGTSGGLQQGSQACQPYSKVAIKANANKVAASDNPSKATAKDFLSKVAANNKAVESSNLSAGPSWQAYQATGLPAANMPTSFSAGRLTHVSRPPNDSAELMKLLLQGRDFSGLGNREHMQQSPTTRSLGWWDATAGTVGTAPARGNAGWLLGTARTEDILSVASARASAGNNPFVTPPPLRTSSIQPTAPYSTAVALLAAAQLQGQRSRTLDPAFSNGTQQSSDRSVQNDWNLYRYR